MIKNILVCLDGSENSQAAARAALWLSDRLGASPTGLHVVDSVALEGPFIYDISGSLGFEPYLDFTSKMKGMLEEKGREILHGFMETMGARAAKTHSVLSFGVVSTEICEKARLADLVVIGRRGVNAGFEYGIMGSVTEAVIRKSSRPVMIVPQRFTPPQRPLLAYDGSLHASKAMHSAAEFSKAADLPLAVITAMGDDKAETILKDAQNYLEPYGIKAEFARLKENAPEAIVRYARDNGHDLIFIGASHHSAIVEMVLGSTAEYVIRTTDSLVFLER